MVKIITDSAADLEPREYESLGVSCIPLGIEFDGREYLENESMSKELFYRLLSQCRHFPKTSQGSPALVEKYMTETEEKGDEAVFICLSSGFSGFYQSVCAMKSLLDCPNCHVVDSLTGTGGQRLLVEHAAALRDQGKSAAQIAAELEQLRSRVIIYACMDTLDYLHMGGRINGLMYRVGSMANIKPILNIDRGGFCQIPAKSIGMRKGMDYLCRRLDFHRPDPKHPLYVMFTGHRAVGEQLAERLRGMGLNIPQAHIINVGAAIGSHIGPGACGLAYIEA